MIGRKHDQSHATAQRIWARASGSTTSPGSPARRHAPALHRELSITGLTSNPTIFDHAIGSGARTTTPIREERGRHLRRSSSSSISRSTDLPRPPTCSGRSTTTPHSTAGSRSRCRRSLAHDTGAPSTQAGALHSRSPRPNLFIKIPGTPEGVPAIEEAIFAGMPINVTLLFSSGTVRRGGRAYQRGIERRLAAGLARRRLGGLVVRQPLGQGGAGEGPGRARTGSASRSRGEPIGPTRAARLASLRRLASAGARPQRLLWASTGTKDPAGLGRAVREALAAPDTINTMPDATLLAFADHGQIRRVMPPDGGDAER